jgi:hypothetical protein
MTTVEGVRVIRDDIRARVEQFLVAEGWQRSERWRGRCSNEFGKSTST